MNQESSENQPSGLETENKNPVEKPKNITALDKGAMSQVESIASFSGIELNNSQDKPDPRVELFVKLRPQSELSDQLLFAEVLRLSGDEESLKKLTDKHPHIFKK